MAAPTTPTAETIATEAVKKAGYSKVSTGQGKAVLARANPIWLEEIKNDIWIESKGLIRLQKEKVAIITKGTKRWAFPDDYVRAISMAYLYGTETGTLQAGAVGQATLAAGANAQDDNYVGKGILITGNTAVGAFSQCYDYTGSTKVAKVSPNFETAPGGASTYMIVTEKQEIRPAAVFQYNRETDPYSMAFPNNFIPRGDQDSGEFDIYPTPDRTLGLLLVYYTNLMRLDLTDATLATFYWEARNVLLDGVFLKAHINKGSDLNTITRAEQKYDRSKARYIAEKTYLHDDAPNLQRQIAD